ncbi:hypothetical protein [Butyrivibrio sp. VCB2001]|uniref:hypothetical protein n=1 Tax=Butyrivibrio sp. VCB2001 TaxID=1280667 RepID=UPI00042A7324|nr:hypothetical protein [Butyrivibrio sp. VCB2001]
MNKEEKIKIAITAGVASVILLILVLFLALTGKKSNDEERMNENITDYASSNQASTDASAGALTGSTASSESSSESAADSSTAATVAVTATSEYKDTAKNSVSGNSFYATNTAVLKDVYKGIKYELNAQLKEMYTYWADGNTEAVRDLAHLERFEVMSYSLTGSKDFYYYGDTTGDGVPNGTGLAVYANNQYYFGEWSEGVRSGNGTWISFYPNYSQYVVKEHMYTGEWSGDLPNGQGQEHYDYVSDYMNNVDIYMQNAIGGFKDGYYNGDMYIITVDKNGDAYEWDGKCNNGTWEQVLHAALGTNGKIPVLSLQKDTERHIYMTEEGAKNNGVSGIITGGNVRK